MEEIIFDVYDKNKILGTIKTRKTTECLKTLSHIYINKNGKKKLTKPSYKYIANLDYIDTKIESNIKLLRQNITNSKHKSTKWKLVASGNHEHLESDIRATHTYDAIQIKTDFLPANKNDFANNIKEFNEVNKFLNLIDHEKLGVHSLYWLEDKIKFLPNGNTKTLSQLLQGAQYGRYMYRSEMYCYLDHDDSISTYTINNTILNTHGHRLTGDNICAEHNEICLSAHDNFTNTDVDCGEIRDNMCILQNGALDSKCTIPSIKSKELLDGGEQTGYQYSLRQHNSLCISVQHIKEDGSTVALSCHDNLNGKKIKVWYDEDEIVNRNHGESLLFCYDNINTTSSCTNYLNNVRRLEYIDATDNTGKLITGSDMSDGKKCCGVRPETTISQKYVSRIKENTYSLTVKCSKNDSHISLDGNNLHTCAKICASKGHVCSHSTINYATRPTFTEHGPLSGDNTTESEIIPGLLPIIGSCHTEPPLKYSDRIGHINKHGRSQECAKLVDYDENKVCNIKLLGKWFADAGIPLDEDGNYQLPSNLKAYDMSLCFNCGATINYYNFINYPRVDGIIKGNRYLTGGCYKDNCKVDDMDKSILWGKNKLPIDKILPDGLSLGFRPPSLNDYAAYVTGPLSENSNFKNLQAYEFNRKDGCKCISTETLAKRPKVGLDNNNIDIKNVPTIEGGKGKTAHQLCIENNKGKAITAFSTALKTYISPDTIPKDGTIIAQCDTSATIMKLEGNNNSITSTQFCAKMEQMKCLHAWDATNNQWTDCDTKPTNSTNIHAYCDINSSLDRITWSQKSDTTIESHNGEEICAKINKTCHLIHKNWIQGMEAWGTCDENIDNMASKDIIAYCSKPQTKFHHLANSTKNDQSVSRKIYGTLGDVLYLRWMGIKSIDVKMPIREHFARGDPQGGIAIYKNTNPTTGENDVCRDQHDTNFEVIAERGIGMPAYVKFNGEQIDCNALDDGGWGIRASNSCRNCNSGYSVCKDQDNGATIKKLNGKYEVYHPLADDFGKSKGIINCGNDGTPGTMAQRYKYSCGLATNGKYGCKKNEFMGKYGQGTQTVTFDDKLIDCNDQANHEIDYEHDGFGHQYPHACRHAQKDNRDKPIRRIQVAQHWSNYSIKSIDFDNIKYCSCPNTPGLYNVNNPELLSKISAPDMHNTLKADPRTMPGVLAHPNNLSCNKLDQDDKTELCPFYKQWLEDGKKITGKTGYNSTSTYASLSEAHNSYGGGKKALRGRGEECHTMLHPHSTKAVLPQGHHCSLNHDTNPLDNYTNDHGHLKSVVFPHNNMNRTTSSFHQCKHCWDFDTMPFHVISSGNRDSIHYCLQSCDKRTFCMNPAVQDGLMFELHEESLSRFDAHNDYIFNECVGNLKQKFVTGTEEYNPAMSEKEKRYRQQRLSEGGWHAHNSIREDTCTESDDSNCWKDIFYSRNKYIFNHKLLPTMNMVTVNKHLSQSYSDDNKIMNITPVGHIDYHNNEEVNPLVQISRKERLRIQDMFPRLSTNIQHTTLSDTFYRTKSFWRTVKLGLDKSDSNIIKKAAGALGYYHLGPIMGKYMLRFFTAYSRMAILDGNILDEYPTLLINDYFKYLHLTALAELDSMGKGAIFKHIITEWEYFLNTQQVKDLLNVFDIDSKTLKSLASLIYKFKLNSISIMDLDTDRYYHYPGTFRNIMLNFRHGLSEDDNILLKQIKDSTDFKERVRWMNTPLNAPTTLRAKYNTEAALDAKITKWKALGSPLSNFNPIIDTIVGDFDWQNRSADDSIIYPNNDYIIYNTPNILDSGLRKIVTEIEMNKHLLDSITIWFMNTSMKLRVEEYY